MPCIGHQALVVSMRVVASEIRNLRAALAGGGAEPEESALPGNWQHAADDLERVCGEAAGTVLDLPPYDEPAGG